MFRLADTDRIMDGLREPMWRTKGEPVEFLRGTEKPGVIEWKAGHFATASLEDFRTAVHSWLAAHPQWTDEEFADWVMEWWAGQPVAGAR